MANRLSEIIAKRDRDSKHFTTDEPGVYEAVIGQNMHYQKPDDSWDDYDNLVHDVTGGWEAQTKDVTFGIVNGYLGITYKGKTLSMRPSAVWMVDASAPATRYRKIADASYANVARTGNDVSVTNIFPGVDLKVKIRHDRMSKEFIVKSRPNLTDPTSLGWNPSTTYLVFGWDVTVPSGAVVKDSVTDANVGYGYIGNNNLVVQDNLGNPVVYFLAGTATSAAKHENPVWYVSANSTVPFGEAFPYSKVMVATYPLVIDPSTTIDVAASADDGDVTGTTTNTTRGYVVAGHADDGKGGTSDFYGFIRFPLSSIDGYITSADLKLTSTQLNGTGTHTVYQYTSDWAPLDYTKVTQPRTQLATFTPSSGLNTISLSLTATDWRFRHGESVYLPLGLWGDYSTGADYTTYWTSYDGGTGKPQLSVTYTSWTNSGTLNTSAYASIVNRYTYGPDANAGFQLGSDSFTASGTGTAELQTYVGTDTLPWSLFHQVHSGAKIYIDKDNDRIYGSGNQSAVYDTAYRHGQSNVVLGNGYAKVDQTSTSGSGGLGVFVRGTSNNYYAVYHSPGTGTNTFLVRLTGGIRYSITSANSGYSTGNVCVKLEVSGSSPTTLKVKVWNVGGTEPDSYLINTTDNTTGNQVSEGAFGVYAYVRSLSGNIQYGDNFSAYEVPTTYYPTSGILASAYIAAGQSAPIWVSPSDGTNENSGTPLVFTSIPSSNVGHFEMQLDTADTFNTGSLIKSKSYIDSGWEYWDGSAWQTLTSAGMPANKTGNNVRYTPSLTGTWYRRVRQSGTS